MFAIDVVIVHPPVAPTATSTNPVAVGAAARLGADSKRRQYAGLDEKLYRLVPFSMEAYGFIESPAVLFLRHFATSPSSHSGFFGECLRDTAF